MERVGDQEVKEEPERTTAGSIQGCNLEQKHSRASVSSGTLSQAPSSVEVRGQ